MKRHSRREVLGLITALPAGLLLTACGAEDEAPPESASFPAGRGQASKSSTTRAQATIPPPTTTPPATATPEPFIVRAGERQDALMSGTSFETPFFTFATGTLGPIVMVLGGVHGNEPGGWLAAERLVDQIRPRSGALVVVPRANRLAIDLFERTTDELGDLNRLYPGDPDGLPMARMAYEILETVRSLHVSHVIDMHESWSFYKDRTETATGTAYLGQTLSSSGEPGASLASQIVENVNAERVQAEHEQFVFRQWPPPGGFPTPTPGGDTPTPQPTGTVLPRRSRSSLGIPTHVPGVAAILVEMGQQQDIERRVQLHVDVVSEALRILGA